MNLAKSALGHYMQQEYIIHDKNLQDTTIPRYTVLAQYIGSVESDGEGGTIGAGPYMVTGAICAPGDSYNKKYGVALCRANAHMAPYDKFIANILVEDRDELYESLPIFIRILEKNKRLRGIHKLNTK